METGGELILFTAPEMGHIIAEIEVCRQLIALDPEISIAILIPKLPVPNEKLEASIRSLDADLKRDDGAHQRISLVELPQLDEIPPEISGLNPVLVVDALATLYKSTVKLTVKERRRRRKIVGIVFDMFCTAMVEVAEEMDLPSYVFFTSGANMLSLMLKLESLEEDIASLFAGMPPESTPVEFPGYKNPVPLKVWPALYLIKNFPMADAFKRFTSHYRRTKGILVNTFGELELDILKSFMEIERVPPVYSVGPIIHLPHKAVDGEPRDPILSWLDVQPVGSVVFICFGSKIKKLDKPQAEQLALGIEKSGHRFLWALRDSEVLPEGFLDRTAGVGKVIGWAPQTEILGHVAVGSFVSHCGWNSTLESIWFGVPIVAWPMYAEQQLNAFLLIKELGLAVELRMEYLFDLWAVKGNMVIDATEVEAAIRRVMEEEEGVNVRKKLKVVSELARKAMEPGGSSYVSISRFLQDVIKNVGVNQENVIKSEEEL